MQPLDVYYLSKIKGIGPKAIGLIMEALEAVEQETINSSNYESILSVKDLKRYQKALVHAFSPDMYDQTVDEARSELEYLGKVGIKLLSITDSNYPPLLKLISDPPPLLYIRGNDQLLSQSIGVAVVGSREHTDRGLVITEKTVDFLSDHQFTVVSGLARGIDAIAHQQTLNNSGKTIAVIVDTLNVQPKSNIRLAEKILDNNGLLISENYPGVNMIPQLFVKRDRIQAGLSAAVFAIETSKGGGTRHAIEHAYKCNRLVYVPDYDKSGYSDTSIPQLEGLKYYSTKGHAIKYTKADYDFIAVKIQDKFSELTE